jgi:putative transposase
MSESKYIHKSHSVSVLLYHYVCPAKYRRVVFSSEVDETLEETCLETGTDNNQVYFYPSWISFVVEV